MRYTVIS